MKKLFLLFVGLCLCVSTAFGQGTIKVGLLAALTGSFADEGQEARQVVQLLADETNAQGGINGKKIVLITEDDGSDPRTASLAATRLATQGVVAVIGTYGSSLTEATQGILDDNGIVQIANGSTAIRLTEKGYKEFFRTCPRDDEQARVVTQTIAKLGYKRIAILQDNSTYSKGLADETRGLLQKLPGVQVVDYEAITPGENDYTTILTKLKQSQPTLVFFSGYYREAGLLLRQKREMGWNVPFIGGDATSTDLVKGAGVAAASGFYFVNPILPKDISGPEAKTLVVDFQKKYGHAPVSTYSLLAGDGFRVVVAALKASNGNSTAVANYLHNNLRDFPGLTGKISFNAKGDRVGDVYRAYKVDAKGNYILQ